MTGGILGEGGGALPALSAHVTIPPDSDADEQQLTPPRAAHVLLADAYKTVGRVAGLEFHFV